ncbi:unnamed protein product [Eretmochelys imbricata]
MPLLLSWAWGPWLGVSHPPATPNHRLPQRQLRGHTAEGPAGRPGDPLPGLQPLQDPLPAALGPAGLTPKQWQDLELLIHRYQSSFIRLVNKAVKDAGEGYPFVAQFSPARELHPNGSSTQFCDAGMNGEDFVRFDADAGAWLARQGDKLALQVWDLLSQDRGTTAMLRSLLRTAGVNGSKSLVQHRRESLERQERPVAVVFARAPPPAGTPASLLLVCRVTGFYPRPIRVAWLQDGEEVGPGGRLSSSGILPNADLTYQLRSSLAVEPGDGHSYACRVEHSSLGGQSLLIPWGHSRGWGPGLAVGITLGALAVAAVAAVLWRSRRRGYQDIGPGSPGPGGGTGPGVGIGLSPEDMDLGAGSVPSSRAEAKHLNDLICECDPSMERSLKITHRITDDLRPYQEMFEQLKRQQRQLPITMVFKEKQPAADETTQSTSQAELEPTTSSTTRSPSPKLSVTAVSWIDIKP